MTRSVAQVLQQLEDEVRRLKGKIQSLSLPAQGGIVPSNQISQVDNLIAVILRLPPSDLTIAAGVITVTRSHHRVDTQASAASDDLDTINGAASNQVLVLRPVDDARTIVIKHNTGNILCVGNADITLDDKQDFALLIWDGVASKWYAFFASGGGVTDHGALTGLGDDDHTQYVLRSILTTNGDIFIRSAGAVSRLGIGGSGDVLTVSGGLPAWAASTATQGHIPLQNEVKAWPPLIKIGTGFDLVTNNHWWDDVGTPTTKATAVPVSGEAGLDAKFLEVIKCVTDAVDEGFMQRYTYADEPRIKSGVTLSAAIWVASTAGSVDATVKLVNSDASETVGSLIDTDGDWDLYVVEGHVCAGTYVDLQVTKDTSGTFYAGGLITVMLGANAFELSPRGLAYRHLDDSATVKTLTGIGDEDTWTDVDCTSASSNLAAMAHLETFIVDDTSADVFSIHARRNGSSTSKGASTARGKVTGSKANNSANAFNIMLDDGQIFEYDLDREGGSGTLDFGVILLIGYWEWE